MTHNLPPDGLRERFARALQDAQQEAQVLRGLRTPSAFSRSSRLNRPSAWRLQRASRGLELEMNRELEGQVAWVTVDGGFVSG